MSYVRQGQLLTFEDFFAEYDDNYRLLLVLDALDDDELIGGLVSKRKGRRNRYVVSKREFAQGCRDKAS